MPFVKRHCDLSLSEGSSFTKFCVQGFKPVEVLHPDNLKIKKMNIFSVLKPQTGRLPFNGNSLTHKTGSSRWRRIQVLTPTQVDSKIYQSLSPLSTSIQIENTNSIQTFHSPLQALHLYANFCSLVCLRSINHLDHIYPAGKQMEQSHLIEKEYP